MPRQPTGGRAMSGAERQRAYLERRREAEARIAGALRHVADGIAHARECGAHWSAEQRQAWLNGLEAAARKALPGAPTK